jgi:hypothetical protein
MEEFAFTGEIDYAVILALKALVAWTLTCNSQLSQDRTMRFIKDFEHAKQICFTKTDLNDALVKSYLKRVQKDCEGVYEDVLSELFFGHTSSRLEDVIYHDIAMLFNWYVGEKESQQKENTPSSVFGKRLRR